MEQHSLVYSFVARGRFVLTDCSSLHAENFDALAFQYLQTLPANTAKLTYTKDRHTFNYLVHHGFTYMVVADETVGSQLPFAFLNRVKDDFQIQFGEGKADTADAHSLDRDFRAKLKEHMQYCSGNPGEMNLAKVKAQVSEVKGIMAVNIDEVMDRGEKITDLVKKSEDLRDEAVNFGRHGKQLRMKMWLQNMKLKLVVLGIVIVLILIIWLSICHGFKCHH